MGFRMEDCSFFRKQAEECRRRASKSSDPVLQKILQSLSDDCVNYANEIDSSLADGYWFGVKIQETSERTWSAKQMLSFSLLLMMPSVATLVWMFV
jgi:hypothetical protein